jgi:hypothetical protein
MSAITFAEAKELVLARLRQWLEELPEAERRRPRKIINFKPYSILDLIAQVEQESVVGREYVYDQAKSMSYVVE